MTGRSKHASDPMEGDGELRDPYGFPPTAGIGVGGYFPSTSTRPAEPPPMPEEVTALIEQQIATLEQSYPGWCFTRITEPNGNPGGWQATRRKPLTHSQRAAGLLPNLVRDDAPALVMALAAQDEIARQTGYAVGRVRDASILGSPPVVSPDGTVRP